MSNKKKGRIFSFQYLAFDLIRFTAIIPGLIWLRPKIIFESNVAKKKVKDGALLISNHSGFFDPIYLQFCIWYRRLNFVCRKEFFNGVSGVFFRVFHCIGIDKENCSFDAFRNIIDILKSDKIVAMFPEGQVNDGSGQLAQFKTGVAMLALKSGKPVVPVYIKRKEHFYNRIVMVVGETIETDKLFPETGAFAKIDKIAEYLYEKEKYLKELAK